MTEAKERRAERRYLSGGTNGPEAGMKRIKQGVNETIV